MARSVHDESMTTVPKKDLGRPHAEPINYDINNRYGLGRVTVRDIDVDTSIAYMKSDG